MYKEVNKSPQYMNTVETQYMTIIFGLYYGRYALKNMMDRHQLTSFAAMLIFVVYTGAHNLWGGTQHCVQKYNTFIKLPSFVFNDK